MWELLLGVVLWSWLGLWLYGRGVKAGYRRAYAVARERTELEFAQLLENGCL